MQKLTKGSHAHKEALLAAKKPLVPCGREGCAALVQLMAAWRAARAAGRELAVGDGVQFGTVRGPVVQLVRLDLLAGSDLQILDLQTAGCVTH